MTAGEAETSFSSFSLPALRTLLIMLVGRVMDPTRVQKAFGSPH